MKKNNGRSRKGFTLIELLVVIAIIAILAVVVVLTLNPAQLLAQSRDSNRVSDFATLKSAIALYQADVSSTWLGVTGDVYAAYVGTNIPAGASGVWYNTTSSNGWGFTSPDAAVDATSSGRGTNATSTGWLPLNFSAISSGAPFGSEPVDPLGVGSSGNNTNCAAGPCMYTYVTNGTQYKLASKMESSKYNAGGSGDVTTGDGGNTTSTYEQGTNVNL
jgi:prepilin-type N-terminal cleavage/methylation domain-containing protein